MDQLSKNNIYAIHFAAAASSVAVGTAITHPLDTLKVLSQVGSSAKKALSVAEILNRVRVFSGYSGLYSGVGWLTLGSTLGLGCRFGVYEILTAFYKDGREDEQYVYVSEALIAGAAAGTAESLLFSPFELFKVRAQVASASRRPQPSSIAIAAIDRPLVTRLLPRYPLEMTAMNSSIGLLSTLTATKQSTMFDALIEYPWTMTGSGKPPAVSYVKTPSEVAVLEGWAAMWRGLRPGLVRDSIFGGIFFSTWQFLHQAMLSWKAAGMDPMPRLNSEIGPLSPIAVSVAAGVSGSVAAVASHGFDTSRSRSQCTIIPKYVSMERKFLKWSRPGKRFERLVGIHPADRSLLYNGVWLRMARCGLASSAIVGSYFFAVDLMLPK